MKTIVYEKVSWLGNNMPWWNALLLTHSLYSGGWDEGKPGYTRKEAGGPAQHQGDRATEHQTKVGKADHVS